ncbi:UDP-N-acetylmuramoyl-tripeptide--D-alanyl-D-alanine ligase [Piscicoccus intestinalis]|uniref:UDP-N-acetylmuramoyl-tripeptide--D-alanyl-D- alanine ligase n=1 Tax=Piscicoccus intestinalis TaxID=746033 RepID=UPI00083899FC|nr:UDP-N-acetylmuramoyl-tripeptide--D-alanyl-D-alanine ligase [Piscicoccus intestinalis]
MIPLSLARIAQVTGGTVGAAGGRDNGGTASAGGSGDPGEVVVDGPVVTDSREAGPGGLYVARIGEHADGHIYTPQAAAAGAVAALVTRPVDDLPYVLVDDVQEAFAALATHVIDSIEGLVVVGITGSSGKTTTKDLLASVLGSHLPTVANVGSLNSEVGVPLTVCRATPDTRYLILEMGARGIGHIRYLTDMTHPSVGVVLNVGSAHVGEFGSREVIATAKAELVQALPAGGLAVLNADDPLVSAMPVASGARVVRTGSGEGADVRATDIALDASGAPGFTLQVGDASGVPVQLALLGGHQVENALAVAAVAADAGLTVDQIAAALAAAHPASRWRMERHERPDGVTILNDAYNANPESMAGALRTLAHLHGDGAQSRRTWAVLGGMLELGPGAPAAHHEMGALARELGIDEVVAVGELARPIAAGADTPDGEPYARSGTGVNTRARWVNDTGAALDLLTAELRKGDVVLLKSSRDSGLRFLGDQLTTVHTEVDA